MAYTPTNWSNLSPAVPLNDANLNKIEAGIQSAHASNDAQDILISAATVSDGTQDTRLTALEALDKDWVVIAVDATVNASDDLFVDTSAAARLITLPAAPATNARVRICDLYGTFSVNNCTIGRNGLNIMGLASDLVLLADNDSIELVYTGVAAVGWKIVART